MAKLMAMKIQGRVGKYGHINDVYEPMQDQHNGKPVWVARQVTPAYLFHSDKNRWCISKCLDDGYRCWAFVADTTGDPSTCQGWTCADDAKEWNVDPNVTCSAVPPDNDMFVQLRMSLEADMRQYGLIAKADLKKLWRRLDYNGNNIVSLAEIDKMVVELVAGGVWPEWLNNKPALMRAYKKTCLKDGNGDDWVQKPEFHALLLNIFWFNKLWKIFHSMADDGTGADRRMDVNEFVRGMSQLGLHMSDQEARAEFAKIDNNHGGQVLFVEFCAYIRKRVNPDANSNFDADIISGENCGKVLRGMGRHHHAKHGHGHAAHHQRSRELVIGGPPAAQEKPPSEPTNSHFVNKKCFRDFDVLEQQIQSILKDHDKIRKLWRRIDFNGNNIVSLAEIDKLCVEAYPLLNHKPALMRAYKMTISKAGGGDGDDWVEKKEFKRLMANLFYFNKIYWVFENVQEGGDIDRRMTFQEFKQVLTLCGAPMSEQNARAEFQKVDRNGGGMILFDEFCRYFTHAMCPHAMSDFIEADNPMVGRR